MARIGRYLIPGQSQDIIQRGNNRQAIFAAEADNGFFCNASVEASSAQHGLVIHACVWMTTCLPVGHPRAGGDPRLHPQRLGIR